MLYSVRFGTHVAVFVISAHPMFFILRQYFHLSRLTDGGRSKPAHLWTQILMQPPLHHHKPVVTKSQTPLLLGAQLD